MSTEEGTPLSWGNAGSGAYTAIRDGRIVAIVYLDHGGIGYLDGPDGEMVNVPAMWMVVMVDDPSRHDVLSEEVPTAGMDDDELLAISNRMMNVATPGILARLD